MIMSASGVRFMLRHSWLVPEARLSLQSLAVKLNTGNLLSSHTSAQLPVGFLYLSQLSLCLSQGCHSPPGVPGCDCVTYFRCDSMF